MSYGSTGLLKAGVLVLVACRGLAGCAAQNGAPAGLRCEYLFNPIVTGESSPRMSWEVKDPARGAVQTAYEIRVAEDAGANRVVWTSGVVESGRNVNVPYAGSELVAGNRYTWSVRTRNAAGVFSPWSAPAKFGAGLRTDADWGGAKWIADATPAPTPPAKGTPEALPAPMMRKEFGVDGAVRHATLYISALGLYEASINGTKVGDQELAPEWTDYNTRVQYQGYDVTNLLKHGDNAIGVMLGDGWYAGRLGMAQQFSEKKWGRAVYGRQPRLLAQLVIETTDGAVHRVVTDPSWKSTLDGPVRKADLLDGQEEDARRVIKNWDAPGFAEKSNSAKWQAVVVDSSVHPQVVAQPNEPIRVIQELTPVAETRVPSGATVFDMGQNMAGRCRVKLRGPAGTVVTLRHAEAVNDDGTIYTTNLRGAPEVDHYTLAGDPAGEVFEPRFTYHGFRFVEVKSEGAQVTIDDLRGVVVGSASPMAGAFECSDPMLNRLWLNILWTQHANMMSVPTDCPQRDERLGWTGDILSFAQTAMFNKDMAGFFTKWMQDVRDAQADDGRYADIAPHPYGKNKIFTGVPAWGDVGVSVPWEAYVNYDDRRLLERHFDSARRWVDWIYAGNQDLLWRNGRHNDYNDWLNGDTLIHEGWPKKGGSVPNEVFATAFFARSTAQVAEMARVLGRADDHKNYADLHARIVAAFDKAYVDPDGKLPGDTQAGYALALNFDLAPQALRTRMLGRMMDGIHAYDEHLSTGFHSSHRALLELTKGGHTDLAYKLVRDTRFPSWGYSIQNGSTTIWERWDGYVKGRGFQDPGMNSLNHWALGSVGEWMVRVILGINPDPAAPGYSHFVLAPRTGAGSDGLQHAKGSYHSVRGMIESSWKKDQGRTRYQFKVPPNTTATVRLLAVDAARVTCDGGSVDKASGVKLTGASDGQVVMEVGAGSYEFVVRE